MADKLKKKVAKADKPKISLTDEERALLVRYLPVFEELERTNACSATTHDDLRELIRIYNKYVNRDDIINIWCSHCKDRLFRALNKFAKETL